MNLLLPMILPIVCLGQPDPGTVIVAGGDLGLVSFQLPSGSEYQIDYPTGPTAPSRVWLDRAAAVPAVPFTTYVARSLGDFTGDNLVNGDDISGFASAAISGSFNPEGDFNDDGLLDTDDIPGFVGCLLGPCPADGAILYVEGAGASTTLGDAAIDLYTGAPFVRTDTEPVTIVDLTFSPLSGALGTPITITMTPAISPLAFDTTTTAQWTGVFDPMAGIASDTFTVTYSPSQFHGSEVGEAIIVLGGGRITNAPDTAVLKGPGSLNGTLKLSVGTSALEKPLNFAPELSAATWEMVDYPDGPGGGAPPTLDGEWSQLPVLLLSNTPGPQNPTEELLLAVDGFHAAAVIRITENSTTTANAPATVQVDLISYDALGVELDRVSDVVLNKLASDGDPNSIVYHNDLAVPIVLVDIDLSEAAYPNAIPLTVLDGGSAVIVPSTD